MRANLSALEVCSRRGAIQIHVYLYLYSARQLYNIWHSTGTALLQLLNGVIKHTF